MLISLNWLRDFVKTPASAQEIADRLSVSGLEVEHLDTWESVKGSLKGFVIGHVVECEKHPNADKLSITKVDIGLGELQPIVCGAPNVAAGQKVIVATVGTQINIAGKEPFVIGEAKIRGEISRGMICAEDETCLGKSHDGIIVLPEDAPIGKPASEYFEVATDEVLEIGLTANRGDAASHLGVARDVAALFQVNVNKPKTVVKPLRLSDFNVSVESDKICNHYEAFELTGIEIKSSPAWLKNRIKAIDIEPKNIVVDSTNYVLNELGQPIHAFDADKISGKNLFVRIAKTGEKLVTLDKIERNLKGGELIIADEAGPVALAGVMGGLGTAVTETTRNILLESAHFDSTLVRKTAKVHGLNTDASFRFERGTDPALCNEALWRVSDLIEQTTGCKTRGRIIGHGTDIPELTITLNVDALQKFAGTEVPEEKCSAILSSLGFGVKKNQKYIFEIKVPTWRSDVTSVVDLYEEILRIYGYDNIPFSGKMSASLSTFEGVKNYKVQERARQILTDAGFFEALNNSLTSAKFYSEEQIANMVSLSNPLSSDMQYMRAGLLDGLLQNAAYNRNRKTENIRFFEFGRVYAKAGKTYKEENKLALLMGGDQTEESWEMKSAPMDFYYGKSVVQNLLSGLGFEGELPETMKQVSAGELKKHDLEGTFFYVELDWEIILKNKRPEGFRVQEPPKFPYMRRDLSLVVDKKVTFAELKKVIEGEKISLLKKTGVFDVFEGKPLEDNKKAVAIAFYLGNNEGTLTDADADLVMNKLMASFESKSGAIIRR